MKITQISQRNTRLNFRTTNLSTPRLPALIWGDVVIFGHNDCLWGVVLDSTLPIETILPDLFVDLNFIELALLNEALEEAGIRFNFESLASNFGFHPHDDFFKLIHQLKHLSSNVKQWMREKKFSFRDLQPMLSVPDVNFISLDLYKLSECLASHSEAVIAIELIVETRLLGADLNLIWRSSPPIANLIKQLKKIRYPMSFKNEEAKQQLVKTLPWPRKMVVRSVRVGDSSGIEVKFFSHSKSEIKKNIDGLLEVFRSLEKDNIERF